MPRPRFKPTAEQRKMVEGMSASGMTEVRIAHVIGDIDPKTLRKHFRAELDQGASKAIAVVGQTAYKMAISGRHPAMTIFFLKCRAGWKEKSLVEHTGPDGGPLEIQSHDQHIEQQLAAALARATESEKRSKVNPESSGGDSTP